MICIVVQDYGRKTTYLTFTMAKQLWGIYCLELSTLQLVFQILQKVLFSHRNLSKKKSIFPIHKEMFNVGITQLVRSFHKILCTFLGETIPLSGLFKPETPSIFSQSYLRNLNNAAVKAFQLLAWLSPCSAFQSMQKIFIRLFRVISKKLLFCQDNKLIPFLWLQ